jgi:psp operon transcriptional activator
MSNPHRQLPTTIGVSEAFLDLQEHISHTAPIDRSVILIGERGTGKELAARRLHLLSGRWNKPYVTLNCSSLAPSLIESELFGHEVGAFTGAARRRSGRFEQAHEGTLFLDEIADLPRTAQEKILRVVEYGQMQRVGGEENIEVDVRLVAATHRDLPSLARRGRFRADLLDRLAFDVVRLPPLRQRQGDILVLAEHFAQAMASELGRASKPSFTAAARRSLLTYAWPGNIRELKNVNERMVARSEEGRIDDIVFDPFATTAATSTVIPAATRDGRTVEASHRQAAQLANTQTDTSRSQALATLPLDQAIDQLRIERLAQALRQAHFNQRDAARALGLTYHQFRGLYRKLEAQLAETLQQAR